MKSTVIILCGGLGTRLREVVPDRPKAMALINDRPFLEYQIAWLKSHDVSEVILAVGFMADKIQGHFLDGKAYGLSIKYSFETIPLGTGGAILNAMQTHKLESCAVMNGDSFLDVDLNSLERFYFSQNTNLCMTCHSVDRADRYGVVEFDKAHRLVGFVEKKISDGPAWINSGIYMVNFCVFKDFDSNLSFSFETDVLNKAAGKNYFVFQCGDKSFIDIGTPESLIAANYFFLNAL